MLTLLRRIRQKLLSENKFSKYLLYALGEIVLVVVGILLALQVNNANQQSQRDKSERKILKELLVNLRADSFDHEENMRWYMDTYKSAELVVKALEARSPWHDSMSVHYGNLFTHGILTVNTSAYDNLKSSGFDLISNDSIRIALTNLHGISYELLRKSEEEFARDNHNMMVLPVLTTRLKMERWFHAVPLDLEALINDIQFRETVRWRGINMNYMYGNTKSARDRVSRLIVMIEKELQRI
jgi:hypothetical protein